MTIDEASRAVTAVGVAVGAAVGVGTLAVSIWNIRKLSRVNARVQAVDAKVEEVQKATNGINEHLVKVTGEAEHAKGVLQGKATEKARENERKVLAADAAPPAERQ